MLSGRFVFRANRAVDNFEALKTEIKLSQLVISSETKLSQLVFVHRLQADIAVVFILNFCAGGKHNRVTLIFQVRKLV